MGEGRGGRQGGGAGDRQRGVDRFTVTFGWADSATGDPEREITLTGDQWDRIYGRLIRLTPRGLRALEHIETGVLSLEDLTPENIEGLQLFFDVQDLIDFVNEKGEAT